MKTAIIENYPNRAVHIEDLINDASKTYKMVNLEFSTFKIYEKAEFPDPTLFDSFILSGGAYGVYEKEKYPCIRLAIEYIRTIAEMNLPVLGICLGHQLIAEALGGKVVNTNIHEIGWKKISLTARENSLFDTLSDEFHCFEYHKDQAIVLPRNAKILAYSANCQIEAFQYSEKIFGVQFHPEISQEKAVRIYEGERKKIEALGMKTEELTNEAIKRYDKSLGQRIMYNFLTL